MTPTKIIVLSIVSVALLLISSVGWAAVEIKPRFTLAEEYNDNIFLTDSNREDDWITTLEPGIGLLYNQRSLELSLDYSLRYRFYKNNSDENQDSFRDVQRGALDALFFGGRPFTLRTTGAITREALNERDRDLRFNDTVNTTETLTSETLNERGRDLEFNDTLDRSTVYRVSVIPEYRWRMSPTLATVFGYSLNLADYAASEGDDYLEHQGRVTVEKNISQALDIWARYQYTEHDNDDDLEDFDRHEASVGGRYQLGARTSLAAMVGRSKVEYDSGFDTDSTIWSTNLAYLLTDSVTLALLYSEDYQVTATEGLSRSREAQFSSTYARLLTSATAAVFWRELDFVRQDRVDESYGVILGLTRQLSQAFSLATNAGYERADNSGPDEEFHRYTIGTSLGFEYRRFLTTLRYRYRLNDSDIPGGDYRNNIVTLSATVRF